MDKLTLRKRRQGRIRSQVSGNEKRPRLAIFKSNKFIYAQAINDLKGETLASADTRKMKVEEAAESLAKAILAKGVTEVVFDRGGFKYTGGIKAFADKLRESGLKF